METMNENPCNEIPIPAEEGYVSDLIEYQTAIEKRFRNINFFHDLSEIGEIKIAIQEHPEEDLAGFNEL